MDFARNQLKKYGWTEGRGLGKNEDGMTSAIKPKLKFDNSGIGHDVGEQFTNNWWERVFNNSAQNIDIAVNEKSDLKIKIRDHEAVEISTKPTSVIKMKKSTSLEYGSFIKTAKLTESGTENYNVSGSFDSEPVKVFQGLTDDQLFAACGNRTSHKGARHGLKLSGKLSRIEKQEKLLLKKMKKVSLSDDNTSKTDKKLKKLKKHKDVCATYTPLPDADNIPSSSSSSLKKKNKKRKSVSFNETITKIYTVELDTSFDSEVGSLRDENSNDAVNNNSGSDEGIEPDLENNNNDLEQDNHRAFEEARLKINDLSKAERKKLKKKRKLEAKMQAKTNVFLQSMDNENLDDVMVEEKELSSKKRKFLEVDELSKHSQTESPERLKRKKNKKKKHKQKKEEAKIISSISKSLEGFCRISESE